MDSIKNAVQGEQKKDSKPQGAADSVKATFEHHTANPGPAIPKDFNIAQEGTKEERKAKAQELNK